MVAFGSTCQHDFFWRTHPNLRTDFDFLYPDIRQQYVLSWERLGFVVGITLVTINGGVQKSFRDGKWVLRSEIFYRNRTHKKSFFDNGYSERTTLSPRVGVMISLRCNLDFGKKGLRVERGTSDREAQNRIGDSWWMFCCNVASQQLRCLVYLKELCC